MTALVDGHPDQGGALPRPPSAADLLARADDLLQQLTRARIAVDVGLLDEARDALDDAMAVARRCCAELTGDLRAGDALLPDARLPDAGLPAPR